MNTTQSTNNADDVSILKNLGENYHYIKTILSNKIEITKLEIIQHIASIASVLIYSLLTIISFTIILTLLLVAAILFLAQIMGSYLIAVLTVSAILFCVSVIIYFTLKPRITLYIEHRILALSEKTF